MRIDQAERIIQEALGDNNARNEQNSLRFRKYLLSCLALPVKVAGREDFPWEEKYVIGGWDKQEYQELKKTNPSYKDEFELLNIEGEPDDRDHDLLGNIRRVSDRKKFLMGLSWLEAADKRAPAFRLLEAYSVWHCNY